MNIAFENLSPEDFRQILVDLLRVQKEDGRVVENKNLQIIDEVAGGGGITNVRRVVGIRDGIMRDISRLLVGIGRADQVPPELRGYIES